MNDDGNLANIITVDSTFFKNKSSFSGGSTDSGTNRVFKNVNIAAPLRYLSNFRKSLEMQLINCKIHLELNWTKSCVMSNFAGATTFKITNTKLYVPTVTLSTDNVNVTKQLNEGFKRTISWNEYKQKYNQKIYIITLQQDFILMLLFGELKNCLFLLLMTLILVIMMVVIKLKETVIENISFQE